jgi:peptidyl-prolyl cis-trans isomerase A (cyclophilin A)
MIQRLAERRQWTRIGVATVGCAALSLCAAQPQAREPAPMPAPVCVQFKPPPPPPLPRAVIETTFGTINCELDAVHAPRSVAMFTGLVRGAFSAGQPFYDGLTFHRVIPGFVIQGGDPLGTGAGGPGFTFPDEFSDALHFDRAGMLALANRGKDTNGSQFFITDAPQPRLDGSSTIVGQCDHLAVIHAIASAARDSRDRPIEPVTITKISITD